MNCPYCGREAEHGYIEGGSAEMNWKPKRSGVFSSGNASMTDGSVVLSPVSFGSLFGRNSVEAYICKACMKIIIDYGVPAE